MQKITESIDRDLKWTQPSILKAEYVLSAGVVAVATLKLRSSFGTLATAESGDGCWTFKRAGFWQSRITIRAGGFDTDLAAFKNDTWSQGGTLEFSEGARFRATTKFWTTHLTFTAEAGEPLVSFDYGGVFRRMAGVTVSPAGRSLAELPILVLFGYYLAVMSEMDAATAAAVTAAVG